MELSRASAKNAVYTDLYGNSHSSYHHLDPTPGQAQVNALDTIYWILELLRDYQGRSSQSFFFPQVDDFRILFDFIGSGACDIRPLDLQYCPLDHLHGARSSIAGLLVALRDDLHHDAM